MVNRVFCSDNVTPCMKLTASFAFALLTTLPYCQAGILLLNPNATPHVFTSSNFYIVPRDLL